MDEDLNLMNERYTKIHKPRELLVDKERCDNAGTVSVELINIVSTIFMLKLHRIQTCMHEFKTISIFHKQRNFD